MIVRRAAFTLLILVQTACSNLFLYPDKVDYSGDLRQSVLIDEGYIVSPEGHNLHYWFVPAQIENKQIAPKGLVVQIHGNAQNLTSHVRNTGWLTAAGYDLFVFDYRGYGRSGGDKSLAGAYKDVQAAFDFAVEKLNPKKLPLIFYGQSLGGTLTLKAVSSQPKRWPVDALVIEGSFVSYQQIAQEKMAATWLTWPLQWFSYMVITGKYSLKANELGQISPVPVYLFYSKEDSVVPYHNATTLISMLKEPKTLYDYPESGHVNAMWVQSGKFRRVLLEELHKLQKKNL